MPRPEKRSERAAETGQPPQLPQLIETFLELSSALMLSPPEQRALLDVTAVELRSLRLSRTPPAGMNVAKLRRRVEYAISILRRMLAASLA